MPFIELHGLSGVEALSCKTQIFDSAKHNFPELIEQIFIVICPDTTIDYRGDRQPFIRIYTSNYEEQALQILKMAQVNFHIEIINVKRFIAKKK
jgi:hypothetical protein